MKPAPNPAPNPTVPSLEPVGLRIVTTLLARLHAQNIPYCHWKSNEHAREGLEGLTDLDVLVDRRCALELQESLAAVGFKRFSATAFSGYPAVEDYLGFDEESGKFVHLHLHYELVLGEKHLKGWRLPWEDELLATRAFDTEVGLFVVDPHMEMVLLLLRAGLKIRLRDHLHAGRGRPYFKGGDRTEYAWLQERVDVAKAEGITETLLGREAARAFGGLLHTPPTLETLLKFRRAAMPTLRLYRGYSAVEARGRRLVREGLTILSAVNRRHLRLSRFLRKVNPRGGRIVAVLGADGSGKSTLLRAVDAWLGWKLDVYPVYHGSGDGRASLMRLPLLLVLRILKRRRGSRGRRSTDTGPSAAKSIWALVLAWEKRAKLKGAWRARHRGMVVVADRYPQNQIMGFNDGPLLSAWQHHPNRLLRTLASWERVPYHWAEAYPPDLIIKLQVEPERAYQRKPDPDMSIEEIRRRVDAVTRLAFPKAQTVVIDANRPQNEVLLEVKRAVWNLL